MLAVPAFLKLLSLLLLFFPFPLFLLGQPQDGEHLLVGFQRRRQGLVTLLHKVRAAPAVPVGRKVVAVG